MIVLHTLVLLACLYATAYAEFVILPRLKESDSLIEVSGELDTYSSFDEPVRAYILVKTTSNINIVYCDGFNDKGIGRQTKANMMDRGVKEWNITLPANTALLDAVLNDVAIRCSLKGPSGLQHFYLKPSKGVFVPKVEDPKTMYGVMADVMAKASHLVWISGTMVTIVVLVLIGVPVGMALFRHKKH